MPTVIGTFLVGLFWAWPYFPPPPPIPDPPVQVTIAALSRLARAVPCMASVSVRTRRRCGGWY